MAKAAVQTTIRIPEALYDRMQRLRERRLIPSNTWLLEAIEEKVEREEKKGDGK